LLEEYVVEGERRSRRRYGLTEKGEGVLRYFDGAQLLLDVDDIATTQ